MDENNAKAFADIGHPEHQDKAYYILTNNTGDKYSRIHAATNGNDFHRDKLVNDKDPDVRYFVAQCGNDSHIYKLINDEDPDVRCYIAQHGNDSHRDKLINDPAPQLT